MNENEPRQELPALKMRKGHNESLEEFNASNKNRKRPHIALPHPQNKSVDLSIYMPSQNDANISAMIQGKPLPFANPNTNPLPPGFKCGQTEKAGL